MQVSQYVGDDGESLITPRSTGIVTRPPNATAGQPKWKADAELAAAKEEEHKRTHIDYDAILQRATGKPAALITHTMRSSPTASGA